MRSGSLTRNPTTFKAAATLLALVLLPATAHGAPSVFVSKSVANDVSLFDAAPDGLLSPHVPATVATGTNPDGIAVSPDQESLYVANGVTPGSVSMYDIEPDGTPVPKATATVAAGSDPAAIAISPDGTDAYVANNASNTVSQYDVAADGVLSAKTPATVAAGSFPSGITVSPDGGSVYVTNAGGGISQYDVGTGGALSPKTPDSVAAGSFPFGIALSPDGDSLYSTELNSLFVRQYDVAANGTLAPKDPASVAIGASPTSPTGLVVNPNGNSVYVTNQQTDNISQFDVDANGELAPKTPATVASGDNPFAIAIDAAGEHVYVTTISAAVTAPELRHFDVGPGGALTERGTPLEFNVAPRKIAVREDVIAPTAKFDSGPAGPVGTRDATFAFSASEPGSTFECALDAAAYAPCSSPQSYGGLADGAHTFAVRATDPWDNLGPPATRSWAVEVQGPEPSNEFSFGKLRRNKRKGTATLEVQVPGPGTVELAGAKKLKGAEARAGAPGDVLIPIRAKGSAKRKLRDRGKAKVRAEVTYVPDGGSPNTQATKVALKKRTT